MVKITFQTVSAQKPEKESDGDNKIIIPQAHVSLHTFSIVFVLWHVMVSQYIALVFLFA